MESRLERVDLTGGAAPPSPAGPISADEARTPPAPPPVWLPRHVRVLRVNQRQIQFVFR